MGQPVVKYEFDFALVLGHWRVFVWGTWTTIEMTLIASVAGLCVAVVCAWVKTSGPRWACWIVNAYIELIRNTPFLVQLFFFFFALPAVGLRWSPFVAALVAMIVNLGAYATEIIRAGIQSIPRGQIEAGKALNLKPWQIFRYIVIGPALRTIFPALASQLTLLMLSSSVVSAISADDLTSVASNLQSQTFRSFEIYLCVAAIYLGLAIVMNGLFKLVRRRFLDYPQQGVT